MAPLLSFLEFRKFPLKIPRRFINTFLQRDIGISVLYEIFVIYFDTYRPKASNPFFYPGVSAEIFNVLKDLVYLLSIVFVELKRSS